MSHQENEIRAEKLWAFVVGVVLGTCLLALVSVEIGDIKKSFFFVSVPFICIMFAIAGVYQFRAKKFKTQLQNEDNIFMNIRW